MPVLVIAKLEQALPLAEALVKGGAKVLEITLRSEVAVAAIDVICRAYPDLIIGAGSVIDVDQVAKVKAAGADFIVSPGLDINVIEAARKNEMAILPGVMTPSEILVARRMGLKHLKLFPAEVAGGEALLTAVLGPISDVSFCPTGGVNPNNYQRYLTLKNVVCVGGSWIAPASLLESGKFQEITQLMHDACSS